VGEVEYLPLALKVGRGRHEGGSLVNDNFTNRQVLLDVRADIVALDLLGGDAVVVVVEKILEQVSGC